MQIFQDYAYYYNAFYKDKDYKAEAAVVDKLLKGCNPQIRSIINFGCGTGKHDIELAKLGYRCRGIDISPQMIEIAKQNADLDDISASFETADIRAYQTNVKFDAVLSLFHVMSYQNTNNDVLNTFISARKLLSDNADGYFLFDAWYGPGVLTDTPSIRVKEIEDEKNRFIRIARPVMHDKENIVDVNYEVLVINRESDRVQTINEVHRMRYFFRPELELFLKEAGFSLLDCIDCKSLGETSYDTWTSYFLAKAIRK